MCRDSLRKDRGKLVTAACSLTGFGSQGAIRKRNWLSEAGQVNRRAALIREVGCVVRGLADNTSHANDGEYKKAFHLLVME